MKKSKSRDYPNLLGECTQPKIGNFKVPISIQ